MPNDVRQVCDIDRGTDHPVFFGKRLRVGPPGAKTNAGSSRGRKEAAHPLIWRSLFETSRSAPSGRMS
jgi:hypothetical protein